MKWSFLRWFFRVLTAALVPYILLQNRAPTSTLAWIWAVVGLPIIGPLGFLVFGSDRMVRKRVRKLTGHREQERGTGEHEFPSQVKELCGGLEDRDRKLFELLSRINDAPPSSADSVQLLVDAGRFYPTLVDTIRNARHHVHVETFIFQRDESGTRLLDALVDAAKRGVEVRLLCDQGGCAGVPTSFFRPLVEAGGQFQWFRTINPFRRRWSPNLKNHRKLQIIDGEIAYVGGMNFGNEYLGLSPAYGGWRDIQVELRGRVASDLQKIFADDWYFASDERLIDSAYYPRSSRNPRKMVQVVHDGPDLPEDPIQMSIVALLNSAQERAWLTAGYFVPVEPLITALQLAALRGVDVRLMVSEKSDHPYLVQAGRSFYDDLMKYGVRIYEYDSRKGLNHAKVVSIDSEWMMVGSANFDIRSMRLNFELNVLVHDPEQAAALDRILCHDFDVDSDEIRLDEFRRRPFVQRAVESLFRPLAPLL